jgi:FtsH-binding integral membrane protein
MPSTAEQPVYDQREPQREPSASGGSGCLEVWALTRAAFGVLFWPLLALIGFVLAVVLVFYLFTAHPALALIPVAAIAVALYLFARWEQRRFRPPGAGPP